ncbi:ABC transporter permease [bacterium BMS3Abin03]|nr:ABC transporter permease [bacterium BMS3Abin03]
MFKNYLKIAFRNMIKNKGYSFINIFGLAVALTSVLLIILWVQDELSWDSFQKNVNTIYLVEQDQPTSRGIFHVSVTPFPMGPALKEEIPEIKNSARYESPGTILMKYGEKVFYENEARCVDPAFLKMFTYLLIKGDIESVLSQPSSLIITEDVAKKYFGNSDPVGKTITLNDKYPFTVTGVIENIPHNTNLKFDILISFDFMKTIGLYSDSWDANEIRTWVQLNDNADVTAVNKKITELREQRVREQESGGSFIKFNLMRLKDMRLYARFGYGESVGTVQSIYIFSFVAVFILIIACINYINLSTARAVKRYKEIGLRKVVGAERKNIVGQFYIESFLLTFLAILFSLFLVEMLIPSFNQLSGKNFSSDVLLQPSFLIGIIIIALITGFLSGTYPALFLSAFSPNRVLKEKNQFGNKSSILRKSLVVFQFALSVILITGTIVMLKQLEFVRNKNLGYDKEQLIYLPLNSETKKSYSILKENLDKDPDILGVTGTYQTPTMMNENAGGADWDGKDPNFKPKIGYAAVDYDYFKTMKIHLEEGRVYSREFATDSTQAVVINEELAKMISSKSVVGKRFSWVNDEIIIGIVKNFNYEKVQRAIAPLAIYLAPQEVNYVVVRLASGNIVQSLEHVKQIWQDTFQGFPLEYRFFDEDFAKMFQADERMMSIFSYSAFLAIIVACLGLFGLAAFILELRTKEIGIRKVLGASITGITFMLSKEFILWVLTANLIAFPVAYYLMDSWLQDYAYRINISWWMFFISGGIALVIALATVSFRAIKVATANPVKSLRYE